MSEVWSIIWDLETGGLGHVASPPNYEHPITQFAGLAVDKNYREIDFMEIKIKVDVSKCDPIALQKNGYDADTWALSAVDEQVAFQEIARYFHKHRTINDFVNGRGTIKVANHMGHNLTAFDNPFLDRLVAPYGIFIPKHKMGLDTMQYAYWWFTHREAKGIKKPRSLSQGQLAKYFGVEYAAHDAGEDVRCLAKIMQCFQAGGKKWAEVEQGQLSLSGK